MNYRFILIFAWFYGYSFLRRGYTYVFTYLINPLAILFLVYVLSRGELLSYAVVGGMISVVATNAVVSLSDVVMLRKEMKIQDMLVASEVTPLDYMLGLATANYVFSVPGVIAYVIMGLLLGVLTPASSVEIVLVSTFLNYVISGLAFFIGTLVPYTRHSWAVSGVLSTVLTVFPPVYYPFAVLSPELREIVLILPSASASALSQWVTGLYQFDPLSLLALIVECLIFFTISLKISRWREE